MVDDASTDNTCVLMQNLADEHPEISLFSHDKNMGGGAARNTAVRHSEADVVFCLDSDDILPPNTLSKMLAFMKEKECDGVTISRSIKFTGKDINDVHHVDETHSFDNKISLISMLSKDKEFVPIYVNFMYTRSAFDKLGGYPTLHGYDTQGFAWRFICAGLIAYVCPDAEYLHRINYSESYFLREYNNGKMNYNWRDILLEHYYVFSNKALDFICAFNCRDFTRNLINELVSLEDVLVPQYENTFGKKHPPLKIKFSPPVYVRRDSLLGYFYRIKSRARKIVNL